MIRDNPGRPVPEGTTRNYNYKLQEQVQEKQQEQDDDDDSGDDNDERKKGAVKIERRDWWLPRNTR